MSKGPMNTQQKRLIELLRDSEPPTAAEASGLVGLCKALDVPLAVADLVERYATSRQTHEAATEEAKNAKAEGKDLWDTLQAYLTADADMFAGEVIK